jgi:hypothetical protein
VTQVTLTQPLASTSPSTHGSSNIPASLIPHMHTPSDLLGHPISHMANSQVIQTTTFTQATQPTSPTLQMGSSPIPFIGGQSSVGGKPFVGGKPSTMRKNPMWGPQQQTWGKVAHAGPSIPTTTWHVSWTTISRSCKSFMGST